MGMSPQRHPPVSAIGGLIQVLRYHLGGVARWCGNLDQTTAGWIEPPVNEQFDPGYFRGWKMSFL